MAEEIKQTTEVTVEEVEKTEEKEKRTRTAYKPIVEEQAAEIAELKAKLKDENYNETDNWRKQNEYGDNIETDINYCINLYASLTDDNEFIYRPTTIIKIEDIVRRLNIAMTDYNKLYNVTYHSATLDLLTKITKQIKFD